VDRRPFRPPGDIERDRLMRLIAEALHLRVPIAGAEDVTERGGGLGRPLEGEHAAVPRLAGQYVGIRASAARSARCLSEAGRLFLCGGA